MRRTLLFILLIISSFCTTNLNAQNLKLKESNIENLSNRKVRAKLNQEIQKAMLVLAYSKYSESTEEKSKEKSTKTVTTIKMEIETNDSSYIFLRSGAHWYINNEPKRPLFFSFRVLFNSNNENVLNYYRFVAFCNYFEKNGDLNYDEIDYISINRESIYNNGDKDSDNFSFRYSSDRKILIF